MRLPDKLIKKFVDLSSKSGIFRRLIILRKSRLPKRRDHVQLMTIIETNHRKTSGGLKHCPWSGDTLKKNVIAS